MFKKPCQPPATAPPLVPQPAPEPGSCRRSCDLPTRPTTEKKLIMRHPIQRRTRQAGFIQGAILFALALIGILVAAFATSNQGVSAQTDSEEARVNASLIIKAGSDVQDAINRAVADRIDLDAIVIADEATAPAIALFDPTLRFGSLPNLTAEMAFDGDIDSLLWSETATAITDVGNTDNELVARLAGVSQVVCRRIEAAVQNVAFNPTTALPTAIPAGRREGCIAALATGTATYYRVVSVDVGF